MKYPRGNKRDLRQLSYITQKGIEEIKDNHQLYTTQESIEDIKSNSQVYTTQQGMEEIRNCPQVYTTQENTIEIQWLNKKVYIQNLLRDLHTCICL